MHELCDLVEVRHERLQCHLAHSLDKLGTGMVADVARRVGAVLEHRGQVDDLPEEGALEDELHVVRGAAVELEAHKHWP
jgi:hypothetical protein